MFATKPHENALHATLVDGVPGVNRRTDQKINGIKDLEQL
jgi:hypothetical protein